MIVMSIAHIVPHVATHSGRIHGRMHFLVSIAWVLLWVTGIELFKTGFPGCQIGDIELDKVVYTNMDDQSYLNYQNARFYCRIGLLFMSSMFLFLRFRELAQSVTDSAFSDVAQVQITYEDAWFVDMPVYGNHKTCNATMMKRQNQNR